MSHLYRELLVVQVHHLDQLEALQLALLASHRQLLQVVCRLPFSSGRPTSTAAKIKQPSCLLLSIMAGYPGCLTAVQMEQDTDAGSRLAGTLGSSDGRCTTRGSLTMSAGLPDTPLAAAHALSFVSSGTTTCRITGLCARADGVNLAAHFTCMHLTSVRSEARECTQPDDELRHLRQRMMQAWAALPGMDKPPTGPGKRAVALHASRQHRHTDQSGCWGYMRGGVRAVRDPLQCMRVAQCMRGAHRDQH